MMLNVDNITWIYLCRTHPPPPPPALWKKKYQKERETKKEKKIEKKKDNFELNVGFQIWTNFFIN